MTQPNNLAVVGATPLTAKEVKAQVNLIQEVLEGVMKDGVHYGVIQGCGNKKTLLKAGAEKIMATFRLAPELVVEDLSTADCARYRVKVNLLSSSGSFVGSGIGECSSNEEKYMYRRAVNDEEYNESPEDRRREKWGKSYGKVVKIKQVRMNVADVANTVLKMAKKRALVDAVLTATAASDIFDQDLEEMPEEIREEMQGVKIVEYIDEAQQSQILDMINDLDEAQLKPFLAYMKVDKVSAIPKDKFQVAVSAIENKKKQVKK